MENQMMQTGALMKEFIDHVLGFYQNIKQQEVSRQADNATLERLRQLGHPPGRAARWMRYTGR